MFFCEAILIFLLSSSTCLGKDISAKGSGADILEQQVTVNIDSLESVLENASTVRVGVETAPKEVGLGKKIKNVPTQAEVHGAMERTEKVAAVESHIEPQIQITPVIATPIGSTSIHPNPEKSNVNSSTRNPWERDETFYLRALILLASISTFCFSGGLLVRSNRGHHQRWHECNAK